MYRKTTISGAVLITACSLTACDLITGPDDPRCPDPITGTYKLVRFEGRTPPATWTKRTCAFFSCSEPVEYHILGGNWTFFEDGTFEETGISAAGSGDPVTRSAYGEYVAFEDSVQFSYENLPAYRFKGECTDRGLILNTYLPILGPFIWSLGDGAKRRYRKR